MGEDVTIYAPCAQAETKAPPPPLEPPEVDPEEAEAETEEETATDEGQ